MLLSIRVGSGSGCCCRRWVATAATLLFTHGADMTVANVTCVRGRSLALAGLQDSLQEEKERKREATMTPRKPIDVVPFVEEATAYQ